MDRQQAKALVEKYNRGLATADERALLENWYAKKSDELFVQDGEIDFNAIEDELRNRTFTYAGLSDKPEPARRKTLWPRVAAAAAILVVVSAGIIFYTNRLVVNRNSEIVNQNDIAPGKNTATLTLANGKTIQLSDAKTGVIIEADKLTYNDYTAVITGNSAVISKEERDLLNSTDKRFNSVELAKGSVLPYGDDGRSRQEVAVATPRGGTYQITLPDGTKVWLNAASELSFPSTFTGLGNRKVELSGEAYFEVAKDKSHPFIVETSKQEVEVLGTHFNINSYADEPNTKTTLLEGSVRISAGTGSSRHPEPSRSLEPPRHLDDRRDPLNSKNKKSFPAVQDNETGRNIVTLLPNQQATLADNTGITIKQVDPEMAIAWKMGRFTYKNTPLDVVMRQISRWYDIDVSYADSTLKHEQFSGSVSRFDKVSRILSSIEFTGVVKFKLKGRNLTITN